MSEQLDGFDADAYFRSGKYPWTIFAYPASVAAEDRLPRDDESRRWFGELCSRGMRLAIWGPLKANSIVYITCSLEDRHLVGETIKALEREGLFPSGFATSRTEWLHALAAKSS